MNYYWRSGVYCKQGMRRIWGRDAKLYERVILAVLRCSRGKWISGEDVEKLARHFARMKVYNYQFTLKWVFDHDAMLFSNYIGLLDGCRTFERRHPMYCEFLKIVKKKRTQKSLPIELQILNLTLKGMK